MVKEKKMKERKKERKRKNKKSNFRKRFNVFCQSHELCISLFGQQGHKPKFGLGFVRKKKKKKGKGRKKKERKK